MSASRAPVTAPPPRGRLLYREPLAGHTSWRVGGPADRWFEPADQDDLLTFLGGLPDSEPLLWIGLGSNLLVRDGGFRGTVIALHGALNRVQAFGDTEMHAEAGVHCARLAKLAQARGKAGLGFLAGIPGTVGGALAMNAGAWGADTWSRVVAVEVTLRGGRSQWLGPDRFRVGYRQVEPPPGVIGFLGARFSVADDVDQLQARLTREWLARRKATQPVGRPSAGSTFRNPPGDHAARLIEACGLKGLRIGGARVSTLHANFIVTDDTALAADVEALIQRLLQVVHERTGVDLIPEVRIVGVSE
jgi:UDP-N-acetylmuramate dehydrogenase